MKPFYLRMIVLVLLCCLGVGCVLRVMHFAQSDPVNVTGDLGVVEITWKNLSKAFAGENPGPPSLRFNQFGMAALLALTAPFANPGFAFSAELLSLLCSIAILGAVALLLWSLGCAPLESLCGAVAFALAPVLIHGTLNAESESPFLLATLMGQAFLFLSWRLKKRWPLFPALLFLAFSCSIRGTGTLHIFSLAPALVLWHWTLRKNDRSTTRLVLALLTLVLSLILFQGTKALLEKTVAEAYTDATGKPAVFRNYTAYVMFDGLICGPFPNPDDWARRNAVIKGLDPETGLRVSSPTSRNDPTSAVIKYDPQLYLKNYIEGVALTIRAFTLNRDYNVWGILPLLLGFGVLLWQRRWPVILVLAAWLSVYVVAVPLIFAHARSIWPGTVALALPAALGAGILLERMRKLAQESRTTALYWVGAAGMALLVAFLLAESAPVAKYARKDHQRRAMEHILPLAPGETPSVMTPVGTLQLFGDRVTMRMMTFNTDRDRQRTIFQKTNPDYIFYYAGYRGIWGEVYDTIRQVIVDLDMQYRLVYGSAEYGLYRKQTEPSANLLSNGGFDERDGTGIKPWIPLGPKKWHLEADEATGDSVLVLDQAGTSIAQPFTLPEEHVGSTLRVLLRGRCNAPDALRVNFYYQQGGERQVAIKGLRGTGEWEILEFLVPGQKVENASVQILIGLASGAISPASISRVSVEVSSP